MSLPDPIGQKPASWGFTDYAASALSGAAWATGQVVRVGILWPLELMGRIAAQAEKSLYPTEADQLPPVNLNDKDIRATKDNTPLEGTKALKIMQGETFVNDREAQLEQQIRELQRQLETLQSKENHPPDSPSDAPSQKKQTNETSPDEKREILPSLERGAKRSGQGIQFRQVEISEEEPVSSSASDLPLSTHTFNNTTLEEYISPLYDGKEQTVVIQEINTALKIIHSNLDLTKLLEEPKPVPQQVVTPGVTPPPPGGVPVKSAGPPPPPPRRDISPDNAIMSKFKINAEELKDRREGLVAVFNKLNHIIMSYNTEINAIKKKNDGPIQKSHKFEEERKKECISLSEMKIELEKAKVSSSILSGYLETYKSAIENNPQAESDVKLRFTMQPGKGEAKVVELPIKEVFEKNLIEGYDDEVKRMENNLKNKILSMNTNKQMVTEKMYSQELKYSISQSSPEGVNVAVDKAITLSDFLIKEKNLDVARETKNLIIKQMKLYSVASPKEVKAAEEKNEDLSPDAKALAAQREKENQEKMKKELQDKISGIKRANVAEFTFEKLP